jgi:hypothetical protein
MGYLTLRKVKDLLGHIKNGQAGCCGTHHIYSPQINQKRVDDLYLEVSNLLTRPCNSPRCKIYISDPCDDCGYCDWRTL